MDACNNSHLLLNQECSDVTLVIDGIELPAHRAILSKGSEYFNTMFLSSFVEANSDKIILKETNLYAFKVVLEYIYTGSNNIFKSHSFTLEKIFEILACARFFMVNPFVNDAISYIKEIFYSCNLVELLNYTVIYSVDELIPYIEDQIKQDSIYAELCINKFDQLLPLALNHFFKFKLYLNVPESTIFKTLIGCIRRNSHYSYPILELLQHIELHLLTENELDLLFEPTKLIDHSSCLNLLHQQREQAEKITKIENKNVIKGFHDLRVIRGRKCQYDDKIFVINGNECYIDIDLKQQFLLNCIKLKLGKLPEDQMSYTVLVSKDMHTWSPIIDHSKHKCFGPQLLYFNERPIRFIRIEACPFDYFNELCLHGNIEVLYSTDPMEIDPTTTFLIPQQTLLAKNLKLMSDNFHKTFPANDKYQGNDLIFQLPQPCIIDSMKLWFGGPTSYHIDIAATEKWIRVFSENEVIGWRYATFKKQPVSYIKITSKAHNHVISFEGFKFPAI